MKLVASISRLITSEIVNVLSYCPNFDDVATEQIICLALSYKEFSSALVVQLLHFMLLKLFTCNLKFQVDRKLVKQTVMTSVYGVTYIGARDQIKKRLKERGTIADDAVLFSASCYAARVSE